MEATTATAMKLFLEGSIALAQVEQNGIRIDVPYLESTIARVKKDISELIEKLKSDEVYKLWSKTYDDRMKFDAKHQLGSILFGKMGYVCEEKTATGKDKCDEHSLLKTGHPFVPKYLEIEQLKKVLKTGLEGIRREVVGDILRPFFHLNSVSSYRSSSSDPNFQNFHSRNLKLAELIRKCFIPREGHVLLEADFKAVEVSVAACVTKDPNLVKYVSDPTTDLHRDTAMQLFFLEKEQVEKKTTRDWSKNRFVFPQFYGSVYFQCAPHIWEVLEATKAEIEGLPVLKYLKKKGIKELGDCNPKNLPKAGTFVYHVRSVENDFWNNRFKVYNQCKRTWWEDYQKTGFFDIVTGFRVRGIYERNQVNNYRIQGPAFHCTLATLIHINRWIRKRKMRSKVIGQIHDCINLDAHRDEWREIAAEMIRFVTVDLPAMWDWIVVPMSLELELAEQNWFSKKEVKL